MVASSLSPHSMHPAEPQNELLQCYDEHGNPTDARPRSSRKQNDSYQWWCAVGDIWVVNDAGEILCSKRSELLSGNPGKWQTYFGGHVGPGSTMRETALRELEEEAGIKKTDAEIFFITSRTNQEQKAHAEHYVTRWNGSPSDLHPSDGEVTEMKWMTFADYWKDRETHPENWCNGCPPEAYEKIQAWLNA